MFRMTRTLMMIAAAAAALGGASESRISVGAYAAAVIDTLENGSFVQARFTVGY